jgi:hypothetical protein
MDVFLGKESFAGSCVDGDAFPGGTFVGEARFDGCIVFCNRPTRHLTRLLPPDLALARNTSTDPDLHPLVFIFGRLSDGATIFGGITFPMGIRYDEFAVAIPFVKHRLANHVHTFVPRMYSSFFPAMWAGNAHYGLSKGMASLRREGSLIVMTTPEGELLFHAVVEAADRWLAGSSCDLPNFAAVQAVLAQPVLGRKRDGAYVESHFGWDFSGARVRCARAAVSVDAPIAEGLTIDWYEGLRSATFEVRGLMWRLSWPRATALER